MRLNSVSQCCSRVSPTILVDRRAFISRRRSIASSRSLICVSYLSLSDFSDSCFSSAACLRPFFSSSRSFSTALTASVIASFCVTSLAASSASASFEQRVLLFRLLQFFASASRSFPRRSMLRPRQVFAQPHRHPGSPSVLNLSVLGCGSLLHFAAELVLGEFNGI